MLYTICPTILHLPGPVPAPPSWRFDIVSALIGAAVALLLAGLAYHFHHPLRLGWEAMVAPLARLSHYLQASAEDSYRELVAARARSLVLPTHMAPLDAVFVEPELLLPSPCPSSISEIDPMPAVSPILPLHRVLGGHPQLAIVGDPGWGRTTLLAYLALVCARVTDAGELHAAEAGATLGATQKRLPLYVSLPVMDWDDQNETDQEQEQKNGRKSDRKSNKVDKLVSAAVAAVGGGSGLLKPVRQYLTAGQAIVLVDGWDELLPQQRQRATAWLVELIGALPENLWLVGAGTRGYAPLTETGFVPLMLAPWDARQVEALARRWMEANTLADKGSPVALRKLTTELQRASQSGCSPLELALRAFVHLSDGQPPAKRASLFDRALDLLLWHEKEPWLLGACRATLGQVALNLQQEERVTASREEIDAAIEFTLPPPEERPARATTHVFRALTGKRGLLRPVGSNRYVFAHPLWQAYLAARQLATIDPTTLIERLEATRWAEVLRFYAELGDMGPLVAAWLRKPDDMFYTRLHTLSAWISAAPERAAWRNGAMAVLARAFLQPGQPAQVRQALAEALAVTNVPGVTYLFKQALQHLDAGMRIAAILGLSRTAGESDLPTFEAVLEDEDPAVREAAVHGLAYMGTDATTRRLARMVLEEDDMLSPVAAKSLSQCGEEGVAFLRKVIESEDVMARRAAVIGLAQVEARDLLEKAAREDEQWIVRSAASAALEELEERDKVSGVTPPPEIEHLPWLISWAAAQGEGVGLGDAARRMLWRALGEGDIPVRLAAAQVLAQIGRPDDVEPLRAALTDVDPTVASVTLAALSEIGRRYELRIE